MIAAIQPETGRTAPMGMDQEIAIEQAKQAIIDEFGLFDSWTDRYEYIVELGRKLPGVPESSRTDIYKVPGCQSQVWFIARDEGGRVHFDADSDAMIVRGLIALLLRVYSDRRPEEILATPPDFFDTIELGSHLSGNRANGLHAMVQRIQAYARSYAEADVDADRGDDRIIDPGALS